MLLAGAVFGVVRSYACSGNRNRAVGRTQLNEHSSRSHAIITIEVMTFNKGSGAPVKHGKLNVVDLAGSERLGGSEETGESAAESSLLLTETQAINLSLTALSAYPVSQAFQSFIFHSHSFDVQRMSYPPFPLGIRTCGWFPTETRSSLISYGAHVSVPPSSFPLWNSPCGCCCPLCSDSLGGTARTTMIVHADPTAKQYRQTVVSLGYASRAKAIKNSVHCNIELGADSSMEVRRASHIHPVFVHCVMHCAIFS